MRNELDTETSHHLLQHKDISVRWQFRSGNTIAAARADDKPILLSIVHAAYHLCHAMVHETFDDPDPAAVMNQLFINVKVGREEHGL